MIPSTPYRFCSRKEVEERQKLGQVSELEATVETCHLPQSHRRLDPSLAVAKYRRSAAGSDHIEPRSVVALQDTLDHLINVCTTCQATCKHPRIENVHIMVNFVTDRLRACQSDATRRMSVMDHESLPASWHAQVIRILIWLDVITKHGTNYQNTASNDSLLPRTIFTMRSTAYDAYWCSREVEMSREEPSHENKRRLDDEILCYDAIFRIFDQSSQQQQQQQQSSSLESLSLLSLGGDMLLEFTKRQQMAMIYPQDPYTYPLWHQALQVAVRVSRNEYHTLLRLQKDELPILARCILTSMLFSWQYQTVQQYNVSFAKGEVVTDMNRLLNIDQEYWCLEYAHAFGGVPVSTVSDDDDSEVFTMTMKQVVMSTLDEIERKTNGTVAICIQKQQQQWALGEHFRPSELFGLSAPLATLLLQTGSVVAVTKVV
jgi:hypothetical protein